MIQILDCTLRDGGYQNDWEFGAGNIRKIVYGLEGAGIDIIECGFVSDKCEYKSGRTKYPSFDVANEIIAECSDNYRKRTMCVVMINFGEYNSSEIPAYNSNSAIKGIRVAFHKKNKDGALAFCRTIKNLGYFVFVQAMLSMDYSDQEFKELINAVNEINPYAFYVVDSFGSMKQDVLEHYSRLADSRLDYSIRLGFHSHNNLQLAFSNAVYFCNMGLSHELIVDASVHGMGRGAGNLNTELFIDYLYNLGERKYDLRKILMVEDDVISNIYKESPWGYSLPNYLSAVFNVHPNYAVFLNNKNTLTFEDMYTILNGIDEEMRVSFDENYIDDIYREYMEKNHISDDSFVALKECLAGKDIMVIAPGKNAIKMQDSVVTFYKKNRPIVISINFDYSLVETDYIFVSNLRRFRSIESSKLGKTIVTTNINCEEAEYRVNYTRLTNSSDTVKDNAGLMLIKLLIEIGARKVYIAGMDGYSVDIKDNYANIDLDMATRPEVYTAMNEGMKLILEEYKRLIDISFITDSLFE